MLKNKIVHFPAIHFTPFGKSHSTFSNRQTTILYCKNEIVLLYNRSSSVTEEKSPLLCLSSLVLYKKQKLLGLPKVTFGLPNASISLYLLQNITLLQSLTILLTRRGPLGLPKISSMLLPPWRVLQTSGVLEIVYSTRTYLPGSE